VIKVKKVHGEWHVGLYGLKEKCWTLLPLGVGVPFCIQLVLVVATIGLMIAVLSGYDQLLPAWAATTVGSIGMGLVVEHNK